MPTKVEELWIFFTKEPYKRDNILQKRPIILKRSITLLRMPTMVEELGIGTLQQHIRKFSKSKLSHLSV